MGRAVRRAIRSGKRGATARPEDGRESQERALPQPSQHAHNPAMGERSAPFLARFRVSIPSDSALPVSRTMALGCLAFSRMICPRSWASVIRRGCDLGATNAGGMKRRRVNPETRARRQAWKHPHPCGVCGEPVTRAFPTCGKPECKREWRARMLAADRRHRALVAVERPGYCSRCRRVRLTDLAVERGDKRCASCQRKKRAESERARNEAACEAYLGKLAFAHAERKTEKKLAERAAAERTEQERQYREARESAAGGWVDEFGESIAEEV